MEQMRHEALRQRLDRIRTDPGSIGGIFPALGREIGRDDEVRVLALEALAQGLGEDRAALVSEVSALYRHGDADERRAVLTALARIPVGQEGIGLVEDALRTNDTRLVQAAMGPYAAAHLSAPSWRHGVLKCLFTGVPLELVSSWRERLDPQLVSMVEGYAQERRAAGRSVPADVELLLAAAPAADADRPTTTTTEQE